MSGIKTLVIGAGDPSSIGFRIADRLDRSVEPVQTVYAPGIDEFDAVGSMSMHMYYKNHGPFHRIVYAAGMNHLREMDRMDASTMMRHMQINVTGMVMAVSIHEKEFPGRNVNFVALASDAAHTPMRHSTAYCSSKAAQLMAVRCMSREMTQWRINAVSPGVVDDTGMTRQVDHEVRQLRDWTVEEANAYEMASNPMGRRLDKDEVADAVISVLNGPGAYRGQNYIINGGK